MIEKLSSMLSDSDIRERLGPLSEPTPTPDPTPRRRAGGFIATLVILVILLWGGGIALILHLERIAPRTPEPASGHIHRFTDTLHTVYLTQREEYLAYGALAIPVLATLIAAYAARPRKPAPNEY